MSVVVLNIMIDMNPIRVNKVTRDQMEGVVRSIHQNVNLENDHDLWPEWMIFTMLK